MRTGKFHAILSLALLATTAFTDTVVKPLRSPAVYGEGKVGKAVVLNGAVGVSYVSQHIKANAGTLEMWANPTELKDTSFLFTVGTNAPTWLVVSLSQQKVAFSLSRKGAAGPEAYARVATTSEALKPGEWHHLAFAWGFTKPGECLVQLYVNGKLKDAAYNVTTLKNWVDGDLNMEIGHNTASTSSTNGFVGMVDEVRISNYPKKPSEVEAGYKLGREGKPLPVEDGTLLLVHFDGDSDAVSATQAALPPDEVVKRVQQSIDEEGSQ